MTSDDLTPWIGHGREIADTCALPLVRRVACLLDHDPDALSDGGALPQGWHICLFTPAIRQSELRLDGHSITDPLMPPAPLPRRVLGGRRCRFLADLPIGARLRRRDEITAIERKQRRAGEMVVITTRHTVQDAGSGTPLLIEEQESIYLEVLAGAPAAPATPPPDMPAPAFDMRLPTDPTLLFRYSAITFNTHRIHYDLPYVTGTEGYPERVVNGGLMTLFLLDLFRRETGRRLTATVSRNRAVATCGTTLHLCGAPQGDGWLLWAADAETGRIIMEIRAE